MCARHSSSISEGITTKAALAVGIPNIAKDFHDIPFRGLDFMTTSLIQVSVFRFERQAALRVA